ncbi:MAG: hypothetical protein NVSMB6_01730 [Burkholderiaceae bacterium]
MSKKLRPRLEQADTVGRSICPNCAVGCGQLVYAKQGKVIHIERIAGKATTGVIKDVAMLSGYQTMEVDFTADQLGLSLFHCHAQLHMDYGFMALFECA